MKYIRLDTEDKDARWVNLSQVSRVTIANDGPKGAPVMAIFFADADPSAKLEISGTNPLNRQAIEHLRTALDTLAAAQ